MSIRQHRIAECVPEAALASLSAYVPSLPDPAGSEARLPAFPSDARAIIYRPGKSAMTSGRANTCDWVLEFEPRSREFIEPLMGWTGGTDPLQQVRLRFPTREAAIAYARREGLPFTVHAPREPRGPQCPGTGLWEAPAEAAQFGDPLFLLAWEQPHRVMPDLEAALLDPAGAFASPQEVVRHPLLTTAEKREILRRWLWDAQRIEAICDESPLDGGEPSRLDEVLDALARLDGTGRQAGGRSEPAPAMAPALPAVTA